MAKRNDVNFHADTIYLFPFGNQWMVEVFETGKEKVATDVYSKNVFPLPYLVDKMPLGLVYGNIQRANPETYVDYFQNYEEWQDSLVEGENNYKYWKKLGIV